MRTNLFNEPLSRKGAILGCTACPLNDVPGVNKVQGLTRIKSRRAFLWAQSPGSKENEKGLELVGASGRLVWDTFKSFGLSRDDFDIQNVCRCQPLDPHGGEEHPPTKRELECCSVFNDKALELNRGKAVVHLIFGDVAGQQLLNDSLKKDKPVFWYEPWDAYVVYAQHPAFILRKGGVDAGFDYHAWKAKFRAVKSILDSPGKYGVLKSQDHNTVRTLKEFDSMEHEIRAQAKLRRVAFDIEDDVINGKRVLLLAGFGIGHYKNPKDDSSWTGKSWSVVLEHPESGYNPKLLQEMKNRVKSLVEDETIRKTLQNGSYDVRSVKETLGATLRGFDYDTRYGTYLRFSFMRSFSLENLTYLFFPEFGDYKSIVDPYEPHFSTAPLDLLVHRNCGDCDITQRLEQKFSKEVRQPLVKVYVHAGNTLDKMEKRGPCLDWNEWKKAGEMVPKLIQKLDQRLQQIAEDPNFECSSPEQVSWLLYDKLGLPTYEESERSTRADVLDRLQAETKDSSVVLVIDLVRAHRTLSKIKSTYMDNYAESARLHDNELRTRWFLTGAVTGRLRSGGEGTPGLINFQNLSGEKLIQNMLVSDPLWRKEIKEIDLDREVFLSADGKQIEIRALAELSGDPVMIKLLQESAKDRHDKNKDFHSLNGHMLTGRSIESITSDKSLRKSIKNLIFGIVFGKSEDGMYDYVVAKVREAEGAQADLTGITRKSITRLYKKFFTVYKGVRQFIIDQRLKAESQGFVETLFGFVRHIKQDDEQRSTYWGNQAINSPVQGTAHQFVLIAMALIDLKPKTYNLLQNIIMEVHDQLIFRVKLRHLLEAYKQIMHLFEVGAPTYAEKKFNLKLQVPIMAETEAGFSMSSMIGYEGESIEAFLAKWRLKQAEVDARDWKDLVPMN